MYSLTSEQAASLLSEKLETDYPGEFVELGENWELIAEIFYMVGFGSTNLQSATQPLKESEMNLDSKLIDWMESQYGLHKELEICYVVDGYEVGFVSNGRLTESHHGKTLREALLKAMAARP